MTSHNVPSPVREAILEDDWDKAWGMMAAVVTGLARDFLTDLVEKNPESMHDLCEFRVPLQMSEDDPSKLKVNCRWQRRAALRSSWLDKRDRRYMLWKCQPFAWMLQQRYRQTGKISEDDGCSETGGCMTIKDLQRLTGDYEFGSDEHLKHMGFKKKGDGDNEHAKLQS